MFVYLLGGLSVFCLILHFYTRSVSSKVSDQSFKRFEQVYLSVYLLAMMGDWLQGPHVYALYESYSMTKHDIELLFIAGFGSSMLFGTIIGSFADKYGRKFNCLLYGITYGIACMTKHFNDFNVLFFGRILAGIATSILYSAFESWLIYEHKKRGYEESLLGNLFANAYFGNSVIAILSGVAAQFVANRYGYVAPFDLALLMLSIMVLLIFVNWSENYGDSQADLKQSFITAAYSIKTDRKVLYLGLIQSLFEGSMYVFVLEWTPAITNAAAEAVDLKDASNPPIPHGFIFAAYMVAVMIGSNLFKVLTKFQEVESFMKTVLFVSALTFAVPMLFPRDQYLIFGAFIIFEICVGIFWPAMGTMRGRYVPETARSTLMNFFRIPLNFIVVVLLSQDLQLSVLFTACVVFLLMATIFQFLLKKESTLSNLKVSVIVPSESTTAPLL